MRNLSLKHRSTLPVKPVVSVSGVRVGIVAAEVVASAGVLKYKEVRNMNEKLCTGSLAFAFRIWFWILFGVTKDGWIVLSFYLVACILHFHGTVPVPERERGEGLIRERKGTFAEIIPIPRILFANCEVQGAEGRRVFSFSLFIPPRPLSFLEKFGGEIATVIVGNEESRRVANRENGRVPCLQNLRSCWWDRGACNPHLYGEGEDRN